MGIDKTSFLIQSFECEGRERLYNVLNEISDGPRRQLYSSYVKDSDIVDFIGDFRPRNFRISNRQVFGMLREEIIPKSIPEEFYKAWSGRPYKIIVDNSSAYNFFDLINDLHKEEGFILSPQSEALVPPLDMKFSKSQINYFITELIGGTWQSYSLLSQLHFNANDVAGEYPMHGCIGNLNIKGFSIVLTKEISPEFDENLRKVQLLRHARPSTLGMVNQVVIDGNKLFPTDMLGKNELDNYFKSRMFNWDFLRRVQYQIQLKGALLAKSLYAQELSTVIPEEEPAHNVSEIVRPRVTFSMKELITIHPRNLEQRLLENSSSYISELKSLDLENILRSPTKALNNPKNPLINIAMEFYGDVYHTCFMDGFVTGYLLLTQGKDYLAYLNFIKHKLFVSNMQIEKIRLAVFINDYVPKIDKSPLSSSSDLIPYDISWKNRFRMEDFE